MPRRSRTSGRSAPRRSSHARTGRQSRSASSSARTAAPSVPRGAAPKQPVSQKKATAPPPATQQPQQRSAMGGFMANVASTGLGVMAGRAMDRALFGGPSVAPHPELAPESADDTPSNAVWKEDIPETVCAREALEFKKCMERNGSDVASCQWNLDILATCQRQQQNNGFADANHL